MATYTETYPGGTLLVQRKFFKNQGIFDFTVPAGAAYLRASAVGVGGQGSSRGGGGAFARSKVSVTPGENLKIRVGDTSTSGAAGDSYVRRNDNITNIVYAARGRGEGAGGLASESIGDIRRDGESGADGYAAGGTGGLAASDNGDYGGIVLGTIRGVYASIFYQGSPGSGGILQPWTRVDGSFPGPPNGYTAQNAGLGQVCLEFFNTDPGF